MCKCKRGPRGFPGPNESTELIQFSLSEELVVTIEENISPLNIIDVSSTTMQTALNLSNAVFTVPITGTYEITYKVDFTFITPGSAHFFFTINNLVIEKSGILKITDGSYFSSFIINLESGDLLTWRVNTADSGSELTVHTNSYCYIKYLKT